MAFDTWTPPKSPHIGTGFEINQRVLTADYGDGYTQIVEDGLNANFDTVTLSWASLAQTDFDAIAAFWRLKGVSVPFQYQLPWDASPKLWRFSAPLSISITAQLYFSVSAALKQHFDLG